MVVPCFNLGRYLEEAVESVLEQSFQDFEIIIVDDGSTDPHTQELLGQWRRPRTQLIRTANRGLSAARNIGVRRARGEYICPLDADDRLHPNWLERAVEALDRDRGITFVSHWFRTFGEEEWEWTPERCDLVALLDRNAVAVSAVVRRDALLEAGLFDEEMKDGCEDWDFWISLVERGYRGVIIPRFLFHYRRRSDSMSWNMPERHLMLFRRLIEKHEASYRAHLLELFQRRELGICDLRRQIDQLNEEYETWFVPELARRRAEVSELRKKLAAIREQALLREHLRGLQQAHDNVRNEIEALHNSVSWRVTRPLRWIYELLTGHQRSGDR